MATTTLPDDAIAEARARLGELERTVAGKRDAAAAARGELDQLEARAPHGQVPPWSTREVSAWHQAVSKAERTLATSQSGLRDLDRLIDEQRTIIAQAEARRIPKIDDAIAEARARLGEIPAILEARAADARKLEARIRRYDVAAVVDEPVPAGEPASSTALLERATATTLELKLERGRLEDRVAGLIARRESTAAELAEAERRELAARWQVLAGEALGAAERLQTVAVELEQLEEAYRAVGPRYGLPGGRVPTVDDQRWVPEQLERSIVGIARGLALRGQVG